MEKARKLLEKENLHLRVFSVGQFITVIAEETTRKGYISYESFPRLLNLIREHYLGKTVTCSF